MLFNILSLITLIYLLGKVFYVNLVLMLIGSRLVVYVPKVIRYEFGRTRSKYYTCSRISPIMFLECTSIVIWFVSRLSPLSLQSIHTQHEIQ